MQERKGVGYRYVGLLANVGSVQTKKEMAHGGIARNGHGIDGRMTKFFATPRACFG